MMITALRSITSVRLAVFAAVSLLMLGLTVPTTGNAGAAIQPVIYSSANTPMRVVALTFDDGPSTYTPQILSILKRYQVPATFFLIGQEVGLYPQYVRAEKAQGELIGDHTFTHPDLETLSLAQVNTQLAQTKAAIFSAAHYVPHWFRPPYGSVDSAIAGQAASLGLRTVLWSVDPRDWSLPGTQAIVDRVVTAVRPGSVVLMHDGGGDRSETVAALPVIISRLRSEGYHFANLDQLFGLAPLPTCPTHPARWFSADGVAAHPRQWIYRAWFNLLCSGANLGPATSRQYPLRPGVMAQDFATTAHRIELRQSNHATRSTIIWGWAARVFSKDGIKPLWGHPITHAWMILFLRCHNRGPALGAQRTVDGLTEQRFLRGIAVEERNGRVHWR